MKTATSFCLLLLAVGRLFFSAPPPNQRPVNPPATIQYWNSDSSQIGYWSSTPKVFLECLDNSVSTFYTNCTAGFSSALTQWNNTLLLDMQNSPLSTDTDISCQGGTRSLLSSISGRTFSTGITGVTFTRKNTVSSYSLGGRTYYLQEMARAYIYIFSDSGLSAAAQKKCITHEFGHALGWFGHSSVSTDVMYGISSSYFTLSQRDAQHLAQIY